LPSLLSLLSVVLIVIVVAHRAVPSRRYHREWWWRGAQVWYLASVRNTSRENIEAEQRLREKDFWEVCTYKWEN
jgi:hypothetical protein